MKEKQPVHHTCDEHTMSSEQRKEYPLGISILRRLKKTVNEEWDSWPLLDFTEQKIFKVWGNWN